MVGAGPNGMPGVPGAVMVQLTWPLWFTLRLWDVAAGLGWPSCTSCRDKWSGIKYLEFLRNFVANMAVWSPKLVGKPGSGRYIDLLRHDGRLQPFALPGVLLAFVAALKNMAKMT